MKGTQVHQFKILEKIGEGGMGEVYEKSGRMQEARREYRTFLDIWKDADPGIPDVAAAESRLSALPS